MDQRAKRFFRIGLLGAAILGATMTVSGCVSNDEVYAEPRPYSYYPHYPDRPGYYEQEPGYDRRYGWRDPDDDFEPGHDEQHSGSGYNRDDSASGGWRNPDAYYPEDSSSYGRNPDPGYVQNNRPGGWRDPDIH